MANKAEKALEDAATAVEEKAAEVKDTVETAAKDAEGKAAEAVKGAKDKVEDVKDAVENKVDEAKDKVEDVATDAKDKVEDAVDDVKSKVEGTADEAEADVDEAEAAVEDEDETYGVDMDKVNAVLNATADKANMSPQMQRMIRRQEENTKRVEETIKSTKSNPRWFVPLFCALMIIGLLWAVVYYLSPSGSWPIPNIGAWNLAIAFAIIMVGFLMTMWWR